MKQKIVIVKTFALVLFASLSQSLANPSCPGVTNNKSVLEVCLGETLQAQFRSFDPSFVPFTQSQFYSPIFSYFENLTNVVPMGVLADFNGDGKNDLVVMGQSSARGNQVKVNVYIALSNKRNSRFTIQPVHTWTQADYNIPGMPSMLNANKEINEWRIFLNLATPEEIAENALPKNVAVLKMESDSAFFGFYSFEKNRRVVYSAGAEKSESNQKKNKRVPSQTTRKKK